MNHKNNIKEKAQRKSLIYELVLEGAVIDVGLRSIVRTAKNYKGRARFAINLPLIRNDLWNLLWERRIPVKVFIELPEDLSKYESQERSAKIEEKS